MKRFSPIAIAVTIAILFTSCATIITKKPPVSIRTTPAGASITIINKKGKEVYQGTSPATVNLKRGAGYFSKASYTIVLNHPGFEEKKVMLNYKLNGWYFGNLFIGGLLGMLVIDPLTGDMWKLENPIVNITLTKQSATASSTPTLNIMNIQDVPEAMKLSLVKIN